MLTYKSFLGLLLVRYCDATRAVPRAERAPPLRFSGDESPPCFRSKTF